MPVILNDEIFSGSESLHEKLVNNNAKWHKLCYNKFNSLKLHRAKKRKMSQTSQETDTTSTPSGSKSTRRSSLSSPKNVCFFCEKNDGCALHAVSTLNVDIKVRQCATLLQDE